MPETRVVLAAPIPIWALVHRLSGDIAEIYCAGDLRLCWTCVSDVDAPPVHAANNSHSLEPVIASLDGCSLTPASRIGSS
jgi:hypothetical protein